jgi:AMMECR1 domain-containing protein
MPTTAEANKDMCAHCFDVLLAHFGQCPEPSFPFDANIQCPLFVTLNILRRNEKRLRGCIGTLSERPLTDLNYFVISSAFRDKRFSPLEVHELTNLIISVSLLINYEPGEHYLDWEVKISPLSCLSQDLFYFFPSLPFFVLPPGGKTRSHHRIRSRWQNLFRHLSP